MYADVKYNSNLQTDRRVLTHTWLFNFLQSSFFKLLFSPSISVSYLKTKHTKHSVVYKEQKYTETNERTDR